MGGLTNFWTSWAPTAYHSRKFVSIQLGELLVVKVSLAIDTHHARVVFCDSPMGAKIKGIFKAMCQTNLKR
jgi:hypothetical protein